jgi:DUF4097 and DUF4098 domain-containing protein YvlB
MSSYPPPPPPPPPGQYPPPYDRYAWKAQQQAIKAQARAFRDQARAQSMAAKQQRAALRMQRRGQMRRSVVGPMILLGLGIVFLLAQLGRLSWSHSLEWYGHWWPAVLIVAGVLLLIEWAVDESLARNNPSRPQHVRVLGSGVVTLLVFLALLGIASRAIIAGIDWHDHTFGNGYTQFDHLFGDRHDADSSASNAIEQGATLVIRDPHGDVTVTGDSPDGDVHVSSHTQSYAWSDSDAIQKAETMRPTFSGGGKELSLNIASVQGGQADLTVQVPHGTAVTIQADRGDTNVSGLQAAVSVSANHGDVDVSEVTGPLSVHVNDSDASLTLHKLTGTVTVEGHAGDTDIADITGDLSLHGDFFGTTNLERVDGAVVFVTSRTTFTAARLDDSFSVDSDSLDASELLGPVVLKTRNKNITLDRVQGNVDVVNSNGSVNVTNAAPLGTISINNTHGSVDLGVPAGAGFSLNAQTHNGDMENDFGLPTESLREMHTLRGNVSGGGPNVSISTTEGDVTVRRASVAALPPLPPLPPAPPTAPNGIRPPRPPRPARPPAPPRPPLTDKHIGGEVSF